MRFDVFPDDVLLGIFDFYMTMDRPRGYKRTTEAWQTLAHVCRRWRYLVFGSPRRLNLRLHCTPQTPVRDTLDVWPALPLLIDNYDSTPSTDATANVIAALGQSDRVCQVFLHLHELDGRLEEVLAPMLVSFPEFTHLQFYSHDET